MTTLEQIQFGIRQLFNGNHLLDDELEFLHRHLVFLLKDVEVRMGIK